MYVTSFITEDYEKMPPRPTRENKPNSNPNKPNFSAPSDETNPIQTQSNPISKAKKDCNSCRACDNIGTIGDYIMRKLQAILSFLIAVVLAWDVYAEQSVIAPANKRTKMLAQWEGLKYGMFIHYGMSTFTGDYRTNKNSTSTVYAPTNLDVRQWIRTAR
jgi:hypothetical protein